jgi:hypothetical protein
MQAPLPGRDRFLGGTVFIAADKNFTSFLHKSISNFNLIDMRYSHAAAQEADSAFWLSQAIRASANLLTFL